MTVIMLGIAIIEMTMSTATTISNSRSEKPLLFGTPFRMNRGFMLFFMIGRR
jgi:aspartate/glutamate racemase